MVVTIDAIVAVDFINVFVSGRMGSQKFQRTVSATKSLIEGSKKFTILVQDSHRPEDPEISIWGPHAMEGSSEAETVPELIGYGPIIRKRTYDAFYGTELEATLKNRGFKQIAFCGIVTDICVAHTVASAFFRGFSPIVPRECTDTYSDDVKEKTLRYMEKNYGAKIISVGDIIGK
ncbi:MAG: isochorismatase family cysteine hydrolase [Thermoplasmatales archaeon]